MAGKVMGIGNEEQGENQVMAEGNVEQGKNRQK